MIENIQQLSKNDWTSQTMYVKLPFLGHNSDKFAKEFSPIFTKFFPSVSFRIIFFNNFKIGSFFLTKMNFLKLCKALWFTNLVAWTARLGTLAVAVVPSLPE